MATDPRRVRQVFDAVIELDPAERRSAVHTACAGDDDLASEVLSLLKHIEEGDSEPDEPVRARAGSRSGGMFAIHELLAGESEDARRFAKGDRVADCEILGYIGGGGMAEVYKARQAVSHRIVAIKVMTEQIDSPAARQRFEVEARTLGHLRHPHIAQVLGVVRHPLGDGGSLPVIVMEYVEGGRAITEFADLRSLTTRDRVELFTLVCDALIHAHQRGVIHRDLKPGNVLVDRDRTPKVIDFGISRLTQADMPEGQTPDPQMLGTPAYASPEHLSGEPSRIDTRSDVLCLGLILYELVARRRAFDFPMGGTDELHSVIEGALPDPPTLLRPSDPACNTDLDAIIGFCVAKDPSHRYQSVLDLRRDLQAWLDGRPLLFSRGDPNGARRPGARRGAVAGWVALTLVALAGIGAWGWGERTGRIEADRATTGAREEAAEARARADEARVEAWQERERSGRLENTAAAQALALRNAQTMLLALITQVIQIETVTNSFSAAMFLDPWFERMDRDIQAALARGSVSLSPLDRALSWELIGRAWDRAGRADQADAALESALDAWRDVGPEGQREAARLMVTIAERDLAKNRVTAALGRSRTAAAFFRDAGDAPDELARAMLVELGCELALAGEPDQFRPIVQELELLISEQLVSDPGEVCNRLTRVLVPAGYVSECFQDEPSDSVRLSDFLIPVGRGDGPGG